MFGLPFLVTSLGSLRFRGHFQSLHVFAKLAYAKLIATAASKFSNFFLKALVKWVNRWQSIQIKPLPRPGFGTFGGAFVRRPHPRRQQ
jgi:hypothetical protein